MISAEESLQRLQEGNKRFVAGIRGNKKAHINSIPKNKDSQNPFAIILGCSDSRVPAEIVFDQGMGDLFVIRVAGNIVAPSQLGSIEFAVENFGTQLVIVLGHSCCGAVSATLDDIQHPGIQSHSNVFSIVDRIRPAVEPLLDTKLIHHEEKLLEAAIRANILASTNQLRHDSPLLETYVGKNKLKVVGAEYSIATGEVDFFDFI
ncbi:MAG: carbonic anhydrase [SAR86 cluster bacterium]|uniref:carbonic anhydrase n=1 Tax=SAR86 cluster bacterium TaxID=2030880 RepID=A0A2A5C7E2_9GAMM|nr:carbonic anhydrase [bacterium AH-315-I11]PCJ39296.1 MAG: carbonic anhydrase [SAR86 cluster bacterium]